MHRAKQPSSPSDDLAARRPWREANGALAPEIAAFCQCGISICLATSDPRREPVAALGLACRQDGAALRVFLVRRGNERFLQAVEAGAPVAATFSQPETHRAIQLKAQRAGLAPLLAADQTEVARQTAAMRDELLAVGYPDSFASGYCAFDRNDMVAIVMAPATAFVQTPGPGAGGALP